MYLLDISSLALLFSTIVMLPSLSQAMNVIGFSTDQHWSMMSVLAAILHLGNLDFREAQARSCLGAMGLTWVIDVWIRCRISGVVVWMGTFLFFFLICASV